MDFSLNEFQSSESTIKKPLDQLTQELKDIEYDDSESAFKNSIDIKILESQNIQNKCMNGYNNLKIMKNFDKESHENILPQELYRNDFDKFHKNDILTNHDPSERDISINEEISWIDHGRENKAEHDCEEITDHDSISQIISKSFLDGINDEDFEEIDYDDQIEQEWDKQVKLQSEAEHRHNNAKVDHNEQLDI